MASSFPTSVDVFPLLYDGEDSSSLVSASRWNTLSDGIVKVENKLASSASGGSYLVKTITMENPVGSSSYASYRSWRRVFKVGTSLVVPSTTGIANFSWVLTYTNVVGTPQPGILSETPSILNFFYTVESSAAQVLPYSVSLNTWSKSRVSTTIERLTMNMSLRSGQLWNPDYDDIPAGTYYIKLIGTTVVAST